jgi:hypothetical protein
MKYVCSRVALAAAYQLEGADPWHRLTSKGSALVVEAGRLHPSVRRRVFELKPILGQSVASFDQDTIIDTCGDTIADIEISCDHTSRAACQRQQMMIPSESDEEGLCRRAVQHAKLCRQRHPFGAPIISRANLMRILILESLVYILLDAITRYPCWFIGRRRQRILWKSHGYYAPYSFSSVHITHAVTTSTYNPHISLLSCCGKLCYRLTYACGYTSQINGPTMKSWASSPEPLGARCVGHITVLHFLSIQITAVPMMICWL